MCFYALNRQNLNLKILVIWHVTLLVCQVVIDVSEEHIAFLEKLGNNVRTLSAR